MIKLPKTYTTNGMTFKVKVSDKATFAGEVDFKKEVIRIRGDCLKDDYILVEVLCHEMLEGTLHALGHRYYNYATAGDDYLFNFTHKEFKILMGEFARGVLDLIEANRGPVSK